MYRSGIEIPKVSFSSLQYDRIPINSYFLGFNLDNFGKLSKIERNGTITPIEFNGNFIEIQKDAVQLTSAASVINFTGSGVTATAIGSEITINIPTPPSGISLTDLSVTQPLLYNNLTGAFSIQLATTSQLGVVKIGSGISVAPDGTISALAGGSVTSVGIQIGTTGNDVHILNSPVTSSGSINLNIPTAAPGIRGALSGTDWVTFNNKISPTRLISTTAPLSGGGDLSADRTLSISQADGSTPGYLSSADWTTFNNKISPTRLISTTAPLLGGGDLSADRTLSISQANVASSGYLSSGDWNTFNDKIGGSGTLNYTARFTGTNTIGIGVIQDNNHQAAVNDTPSSDTMLKVNANGFEQYAIKAINTSGGGFAYPSVGLWSQSQNRAGDAYGADIKAESTVGQTSIGARVIALDGSDNYSLELLDGTETPAGGKFLRDMGAGKANWAEINLDLMETLTRPQIAALITSNSLIPGKWYRHQYSILRHSQGGIDSHYDIILLATSTNTLSTRGHRIMRVPNGSDYVGGMFDDRVDYYVGMEAIFGNLVYICIQDCPIGTISARTGLDPLYFDVIDPLTSNQYYTTQVYDIIFNWDYENNGPNDDWEGSTDRIVVQSDSNGNVVHRTAEIDTFDSYHIQQSSIDLHEWNNRLIRDNEFYGAWNNARRTTLRVPSSIYQNRLIENTVAGYYGQEPGQGLIWKNKCNSIFDNRGGSIYNNPKAHEISRNDCTLISNNTIEYGSIMDNSISEISYNIIGGSIIANRGKYYDNSDNTKIKGNEGGFELGIVDNELFAGGEISFNNISVTVRHNRIYKIINNGQLGGLEGALEINSNFGMFIISENQLVSTSKINGNTIAQSANSDNPYSENGIFGIVYNTCDSIMYNNLLEGGGGIYNNSNEGQIRANRVVAGIWNNYSPVQEISYNDAYSIQNNS
jgi:hypothetical protein